LQKNGENFNELNFCDKIMDFVAKYSHQPAPATRQIKKQNEKKNALPFNWTVLLVIGFAVGMVSW